MSDDLKENLNLKARMYIPDDHFDLNEEADSSAPGTPY
jgi:hypothetical protein